QINHGIQQWGDNSFNWIKERVNAATTYFQKLIQPQLSEWYEHIESMPEEMDPFYIKYNVQQYQNIYLLEKKITELNTLVGQLQDEASFLQWDYSAFKNFEATDVRFLKYASKKSTSGASNKTSIDLFNAGTSIDKIAQFRGIKESTVMGHLAEGVELGQIKAERLIDKKSLDELVVII